MTCDGHGYGVESQDQKPLLTKIRQGHIPILPATVRFKGQASTEFFDLFRDKLVLELTPYVNGEEWQRLVLQSCHIPAIRHVVIAIGALHRWSMARQLKDTIVPYETLEAKQVCFASFFQYMDIR